jgi:hypothetical protein
MADQHDPLKGMSNYLTDKYFDAIKQVGTANSAGLFAGAVALYYFKDRTPDLVTAIKVTTGLYLAGVVLFALAYFTFIVFLQVRETARACGRSEPDGLFFSTVAITALSLGTWAGGTIMAVRVLNLL